MKGWEVVVRERSQLSQRTEGIDRYGNDADGHPFSLEKKIIADF